MPHSASKHAPEPTSMLTYPLVGGYLHHWLALGPVDQPLTQTPRPDESPAEFGARTLHELSQFGPDYVNPTELDRAQFGDHEHFWEAVHCQDDHWLAWHDFLPRFSYRRAWGYLHLTSARSQIVTLHISAASPLRLWLNDAPIVQIPAAPQTTTVTTTLTAGTNRLLLRLEQVGVREVALGAAVRVEQMEQRGGVIQVQLPTVSRDPRRRQWLEGAYAQTRLDRAVYTRGDAIRLLSPRRGDEGTLRCAQSDEPVIPNAGEESPDMPVQLRLQKPSGAIYAETIATLDPGAVIESVRGSQLPDGPLDAVVMAPFQLFYEEKLRARHTLPFWVANQPFHSQPPESERAADRLVEALRAQAQGSGSVYAEVAKMAFGWWELVDSEVIRATLARLEQREVGLLPDLLGLITLRARMPAYRGFPQALLPDLDRGLVDFAIHRADTAAAWDAATEANQLMLLAARYLLAELYPHTATASSLSAETLIGWLAQAGRMGLHDWQSDSDLWVTALAPLATLAQDEGVREMAAALLDQVAFGLAIHSFQGVFGASRARVTPAALRSGRFAPEAALSRLLWGSGGYQTGLAATTALGLASNAYQLPDLIRTIALAQPDELWVRERHGEANLVSYKTPDYLLSSVQDHRAGARGSREQVWQATLGPEALVFSNHPLNNRQAEASAPGWWVGNGVLPRVAQHKDSLIALYALPADDWMGFTHAYFPIYAFDEHRIIDGWAFARRGDGYLALWAAPSFTLAESGPDAGRELRVLGHEAVWLCQMGRRAVDGDFAAFQRKVLANPPQHRQQGLLWTTIRGDTLAFGMTGPFTINDQPAALDNFPRHASPFGQADFPADHLDILHGEDGLRLHFGS